MKKGGCDASTMLSGLLFKSGVITQNNRQQGVAYLQNSMSPVLTYLMGGFDAISCFTGKQVSLIHISFAQWAIPKSHFSDFGAFKRL